MNRQEYMKEYLRKYYLTHKNNPDYRSRIMKNVKIYQERHPDFIRQLKRDRIKRVKTEVYRLLGNKCVRCGFDDIRALQIDHVNGRGNLERQKKGRGGTNFYFFLLKELHNGSKEYQILCANCNWIKRSENKEDG